MSAKARILTTPYLNLHSVILCAMVLLRSLDRGIESYLDAIIHDVMIASVTTT